MTLLEKQYLFMKLLPRLLDKINETHQCTGGDLWSKPEYKAHMDYSTHYDRLAIDINLFLKGGAYSTSTEDYRSFGEFWESLHELCCWGGKWGDGNHFSITHNGRK
jgi:hypothetical protein